MTGREEVLSHLNVAKWVVVNMVGAFILLSLLGWSYDWVGTSFECEQGRLRRVCSGWVPLAGRGILLFIGAVTACTLLEQNRRIKSRAK